MRIIRRSSQLNRAFPAASLLGLFLAVSTNLQAQQDEPEVRWPKWAERVYDGIETTRDQQNDDLYVRRILSRNDQTPQSGIDGSGSAVTLKGKVLKDAIEDWEKQWPALYELDSEVDMLASALLALQRPDVVIELYECWYLGRDRKIKGKQQLKREPFRTPAAILLFSRAHRDRAWQYIETPPLELDRLTAFEKANQHMVKAFERLESARKSIKKDGLEITGKDKELFGYWIANGLPRPQSLTSWKVATRTIEKNGNEWKYPVDTIPIERPDERKGFERSRPFPAFQALDYTVAFLEWEARIKRELGDMVFKVTGGSGRPVQSGNTFDGFDVLAKVVNNVNEITKPDKGDSWVIVALVNNDLYVSIFDSQPQPVIDKPIEKQKITFDPKTHRALAELKREFDAANEKNNENATNQQSNSNEITLSPELKRRIIDEVVTIAGVPNKPKNTNNPTATAYYIETREALYLARLIKYENRQLLKDALDIDDRFQWLVGNLPYGGKDFFQFEPYSPANYWTVWQSKLGAQLKSMEADWRDLRTQREKATAWINQIQENDRNSDMLTQQFKFQMNFAIREKMADIQFDLINLTSDRAQTALHNLSDEMAQFTAESSLQLDALVYEQELARVKGQIVDEALTRIGEVRRGGSLADFRVRFFPNDVVRNRYEPLDFTQQVIDQRDFSPISFSIAERREDLGLVTGMVNSDRRMNAAWQKVMESENLGEIDRLASQWRAAQVELEMAKAELRNRQNIDDLAELEKQDAIFKQDIAGLVQELENIKAKQQDTTHSADVTTNAEIQTSVIDRLKREIERAKDKVRMVEGRIGEFRKYVQQTRQTIQTARDWAGRVEKAYDTFQALTQVFSSIPTTIAGPAGGVVTDPSGSFEKKGRAALDKIKGVYDRLVQSKDFDELLDNLDKEALKLQDSLVTLRGDADNRLADLQVAVQRSALNDVLAVPPPDVLKGIQAKVDAIRQVNVAELQKRVQKIHEDFRAEGRGTFLEGAINQLADTSEQAIESRITAMDQTVRAETDRAFEQARQRFLEAVRTIESWKDGEKHKATPVEGKINEKDYAKVFTEYAIQKAEAEHRLAQARIRQADLEGKRLAIQAQVRNFEREQLQRGVEASTAKERAARAGMMAAITDQETAWLRLVNTASRWNVANDQAAELGAQVERINLKLDEFRLIRSTKQEVVANADTALDKAMKDQEARIEQLAAELQQLNKPEGRILTADMLDRLAPALIAMEGTSEAQQRLRDGIDIANAYLVEYARWLYLLSGDRNCILYASRCDSFGELMLSKQGLDKIAEDLRQKTGLARTGVLAINIPENAFGGFKDGLTSIAINLVHDTDSTAQPTYLALARDNSTLSIKELSQLGAGDQTIQEFFRYDLADASVRAPLERPMLLCGMVPVINWNNKTERGIGARVRPGSFAKSGFSYADQIPFKYSFDVGHARVSDRYSNYAAADWLERFTQSEHQLAAGGQSLLDNPGYAALPNIEYFGRAVEGRYQIELKIRPGTTGNQNELANVMKSVDVFIYYLIPATSSEPLATPQRLTLADLKLGGKGQTGNGNSDTPNPNSGSITFDDAWDGKDSSGDFNNALEAKLKLISDNNGLKSRYEDYVTGDQTDPNTSDLMRPISLTKLLKTADALLVLLSNDVQMRAEEPLATAADIVNTNIKPNREALTILNAAIATHNRRFRNLQDHVAKLKLIDGVISGTNIVIEGETLKTLEEVTNNPEAMKHLVLYSIVRSLELNPDDDKALLMKLMLNLKGDYDNKIIRPEPQDK